ncbi:putative RING-H2 finger protein ATL21A [Syzygium oleosum]|uniref:putative RING-H2 finger protein ATL21A n=1 Tax=Syzygium oleosum TaxID=219896 RepID=UPI0011D1A1CB|nr:putative RING-H2 finger protein ATL21A [Syzygium oleosum]
MANDLSILFFLFTFFFILHLVFTHPSTCSTKFCKPGEPGIRYPFRLKQLQPDERCVFPGFDLSCNGQNRTTLTLPLLGEFIVDSIDYVLRVIQIQDPDDCLPKRLHNFTTASSIWTVQQYSNFTFFNCPKESRAMDMFMREPCLDGHNYNVVVIATDEPGVDLINLMEELRCNYSQTISIPTIDTSFTPSGVTYTSSIRLMWKEPFDCIICEAITDTLGSKGKAGFEIGCPISPSDHDVDDSPVNAAPN